MTLNHLLAVLDGVVDAYRRTGNPDLILCWDTTQDAKRARELARTQQPDQRERLFRTLGRLHWYRSRLLDGPEGWTDHDDPWTALFPWYATDPSSVPSEMRKLFDDLQVELAKKTPLRDADEARYLALQGSVSRLTGWTADTAESDIAWLRRAVGAAPDNDPKRAGYLANLASALQDRFGRTGEVADLDEAVQFLRRAVQPPGLDTAERARRLTMLSDALRVHGRATGEQADLAEADTLDYRSARATRDGKPEVKVDLPILAVTLDNMPSSLAGRVATDTTLAALDNEVDRWRQELRRLEKPRLVTMSTGRGSDTGRARSRLGAALLRRFAVTGRLPDLDEAIEAAHLAASELDVDRPDRAVELAHIVTQLRTPIERFGSDAMADALAHRAITVAIRTVELTPVDHPDYTPRASTFGELLLWRHRRGADRGALAQAVRVFQNAVDAEGSPLSTRVTAAITGGRGLADVGDWAHAAELLAAGIELLPHLASAGLSRRSREHWLAETSGLARDAAACALAANDATQAMIVIEHGRGVLLSDAFARRQDVPELRAHDPELAERFAVLRRRLDADDAPKWGPTVDGFTFLPPATSDDRLYRRQLNAEFDGLLDEIRRVPGFDRFLLPPHPEDMIAQAAHGPLVVLNVSEHRSDALIVTRSGIRSVPLPLASLTAVREQVAPQRAAIDEWARARTRRDRDSQLISQQYMSDVLAWLWDAIALPVLDSLELAEPQKSPPRVWWVPTGPLGELPVHSAQTGGTGVLDRVISSYTPTIGALRHVRRRPKPTTPPTALAVTMPKTPGWPSLDHVSKESRALQRHVRSTRRMNPNVALRQKVTAALADHRWVHFACHATSNPADPSAGRLILLDHETHPFTAADIAALNLKRAELAFLSACQTAHPGDRLADEAIHLASSFQAAGYRHVIATLWSAQDEISPILASDFYAQLTQHSGEPAVALNHAQRLLRSRYPNFPILWAAHVHMGP